jgi:hypothetical protein
MSCRSNAGNSAVTSHARITTGLSDMQTLSTFHALIREGAANNIADPTSQQVDQWVATQVERINTDENLTPARRVSLTNRLEQVRQPTAPLPNGATFYAWQHMDERARVARTTLDRELDRHATRLGLPREEVQRRFEADRAAADANRTLTVPSQTGTTSNNLASAGYCPADRGTLYALHRLQHAQPTPTPTPTPTSPTVSNPPPPPSSATRPRVGPEIVRRSLNYNEHTGIYSVGYDPQTRHLEVELRSGNIRRYEDIDPEFYAELSDPNLRGSRAIHIIDAIRLNQIDAYRQVPTQASVPPSPLPVPPPTPDPIAVAHPRMNPIVRQPVTSTNVSSLGYDPTGRRLQVEFHNGSVYEYTGVSAETYRELTAPGVSVGSTYNHLIRGNDAYISRRLPDGHTDVGLTARSRSRSRSQPQISIQAQAQARCPDCGEFISEAVAHLCRNRNEAEALTEDLLAHPATMTPTATATATTLPTSTPHASITPEALRRALSATSFGNITDEQLRNIRQSEYALLSPTLANYAQTTFTQTTAPGSQAEAEADAEAEAEASPSPTTTSINLNSPNYSAIRGFFNRRGLARLSGGDVNILIGASQVSSQMFPSGRTRNEYASVEGSVRLHRSYQTGEIRVADATNLSCTCQAFRENRTCSHITQTVAAIDQRYNQRQMETQPGGELSSTVGRQRRRAVATRLDDYLRQEREASEAAQRAAQAQAQAQAEQAAARLREQEPPPPQEQSQRQAPAASAQPTTTTTTASATSALASAPVSYRQDMAAFQRSYAAAKERKARGEAPVPYLRENATNGLGARNGGRGFGVEIEFDLDHLGWNQKTTALRAIGREMYEAGLTNTAEQQGYHAGNSDYSRWRFEEDSTVSGEIVSPILYDEPQTWQQLEKVCEIVRRHGGKATTRTGGHVHIACGNYDHTPRNHNNLLQLFKQNEDVVYRLAQNPEAGSHRGTNWCRPNNLPAQDYTTIQQVQQSNNSHHIGLNFQSVNGSAEDHVEFRMWDGTIDPAAIQSQIKMSLAMTETAFRAEPGAFRGNAERKGTHRNSPVRTQARAAGANANGGTTRRLSGGAWEQDTESFRGLVDKLFTRNEDKEQLTALFAVTKWQNS